MSISQGQIPASLVSTKLSTDGKSVVQTYESNLSQSDLTKKLANLQNIQSKITSQIADTQEQLAMFNVKPTQATPAS